MTLTQTQNLKLNWTRQKQNFCLLTRNYLDTRYKINQNCETMVEREEKSRTQNTKSLFGTTLDIIVSTVTATEFRQSLLLN
jgi:hypothetical protein